MVGRLESGSRVHLQRAASISKVSAQFFFDWVRERMGQIKLADSRQQDEVLQPHRQAEQFWLEKVAQANAE